MVVVPAGELNSKELCLLAGVGVIFAFVTGSSFIMVAVSLERSSHTLGTVVGIVV